MILYSRFWSLPCTLVILCQEASVLADKIVNDLKPFQGLWVFLECKFSPLQGERYFCNNRQGYSKILSSKSLEKTCEGVDFFKLQA